MNQELQKFIVDGRAAGMTDEKIRGALLSTGWSTADIDATFAGIDGKPVSAYAGNLGASIPGGNLPGPVAIFNEAWDIFKTRWKTFAAIAILPMAIGVAMGLIAIVVIYAYLASKGVNPIELFSQLQQISEQYEQPAEEYSYTIGSESSLTVDPFTTPDPESDFSNGDLELRSGDSVSQIPLESLEDVMPNEQAIWGITGAVGLVVLVTILLQYWSSVALIIAVRDSEEQIGMMESFRRAWKKLFGYGWIGLLVGVVIMAGLMLLIIPGLIFAMWYGFAPYVYLTEDKKGWSAAKQSREYIRGKVWLVIGRYSFIILISIVASIVLSIVIGIVDTLFSSLSGMFISANAGSIVSSIANLLSNFANTAVVTPIVTIYSFLLFLHLKATSQVPA